VAARAARRAARGLGRSRGADGDDTGARIRLRAARLGQGDNGAAHDSRPGRARGHRRWLAGPARGSLPFALLAAGGTSALGLGFAVWVLAATAVLVLALVGELRAGRQSAGGVAALVAAGVLAALVAALPTWVDLSGSVNVAQDIASTCNPGNLRKPLQAIQAFGVWLRGSYKQSPLGAALGIARALVAVAALAALLGTVQLLRRRRVALTGWLVLMLAVRLALAASATTWGKAKEEMLTSPVVVLLSWAGSPPCWGPPGRGSLLPSLETGHARAQRAHTPRADGRPGIVRLRVDREPGALCAATRAGA